MSRSIRPREVDAQEPVSTVRAQLEGLLGIPFSDGNAITPLRNGCRIFPAMLEVIEAAEHTIEFLTFVYWKGAIADRFARTLAGKARQGVQVRVVLDAFGAAPMSGDLLHTMTEAGVEVRWFRPLQNWKLWKASHRTHRKVLIVDARVGFTGGVGIAEEWEGDARNPGEWRDTHFRIDGPAVVMLRAAFFSNWAETDRQAVHDLLDTEPQPACGKASIQVVRSTACFGWSDIATLLDSAIALARQRIRIATAYFAPDETWVGALGGALDRGVEIEILIPGPYTDSRISELAGAEPIEQLLAAGVRFWRFQPTMLHSKTMIVDDQLVCIGSANFNQRSILKDDEVALAVMDRQLTATLDADFEDDLARSEAMTPGRFRSRGVVRRLRELIARPVRSNV